MMEELGHMTRGDSGGHDLNLCQAIHSGEAIFYIHDSQEGFTHGCVETCNDLYQRLIGYRMNGNSHIDFKVDYHGPFRNDGTKKR
jgi:hypothetical protein